MMANRETDIHNRTLAALTKAFHPHGIFWRQNSGRVQTADGRWVLLGPPGIADIVGLVLGQAVFVEVKTASGRQRPAQAAFQHAVEKAGGLYIIARSPEEAVAGLTAGLTARGLAVPPPPGSSQRPRSGSARRACG